MVFNPVVLRGDYVQAPGTNGHERQQMAQNAACICVVDFHFNWFNQANAHGGGVIYQQNNPASRPFAQVMWAEFAGTGLPAHGAQPVQSTQQVPRGAYIDFYSMPTVLIEPLFISNPNQAAWLHNVNNLNRLADAITAAIRGQFLGGGTIGLSPGHALKTTAPNDRGAQCAQGDWEADHSLALVDLVRQRLSSPGPLHLNLGSPSPLASHRRLSDGTKPGVFRWRVKTLQDAAASQVDFANSIQITLDVIAGWRNPGVDAASVQLPRGAGAEEFEVFHVTGTAIKYKLEDDGDYHLLIEDENGFELGVEVVQPLFAPQSIKLAEIQTVRQLFEQNIGHSSQVDHHYNRVSIPVTVTGVGFWDEPHGQGGIGSGFELHPVLSIQFQ